MRKGQLCHSQGMGTQRFPSRCPSRHIPHPHCCELRGLCLRILTTNITANTWRAYVVQPRHLLTIVSSVGRSGKRELPNQALP